MQTMTRVSFYLADEVPDARLGHAVTAARCRGQWIFCRHKARSTWEMPGGHRETGEDILETAKRELFEETGAAQFELTAVCPYGVTRDGETTYGLLCFAEVQACGALPKGSEIGETRLFAAQPDALTYPDIQPFLYARAQGWLNTRSALDELWDIYDADRSPTGRTHRRGDPMRRGDYHIVIHAWLMGADGRFLLTKRAPTKGYPNLWECTGGSALAGEDSLMAAVREVREETGLTVRPENGARVLTLRREDSFLDIWLFRQAFDLRDVVLQPGETADARCAARAEILSMHAAGTLVPFDYLDALFDELARD